jgi:hypothetical protein
MAKVNRYLLTIAYSAGDIQYNFGSQHNFGVA